MVHVFNTNRNASGSFIFRKVYEKSAVGSRLGLSFGLSDENTEPIPRFEMTSMYEVSGDIGYERHIPVMNRWALYYGGDLGTFFNRSNRERDNTGQNKFMGQSVTSRGLPLSPLLGVRFKVNSRISLVTETKFFISYAHNIRRDVVVIPGNARNLVSEGFSFNGYSVSPYSLYLMMRL
ncbi:hypothetical protein N9933_02370 [bacterium]|nr:hypothetical protein [bacterium]